MKVFRNVFLQIQFVPKFLLVKKKTTKDGKGYLRDIEKELKKLLAEGDDEATVRFVKEKVLESYRNGIDVGKSTKKTTKKKPAKVAS